MLSSPGVDFQGGEFCTTGGDGAAVAHSFDRGDCLVFQSHRRHHVTPVTAGRRNVLILEFWKGEERHCGHRCTRHWGACGYMQRTQPPHQGSGRADASSSQALRPSSPAPAYLSSPAMPIAKRPRRDDTASSLQALLAQIEEKQAGATPLWGGVVARVVYPAWGVVALSRRQEEEATTPMRPAAASALGRR
eukprot:COSAG01_NODE_6138_length_3829_cov_4.557105_2_plen_191_part_00